MNRRTKTAGRQATSTQQRLPRTDRGAVTVLGLGRMGGAIAERLADVGYAVTGWNRTARAVPGGRFVPDAASALVETDIVVLALFDAAACREVLKQIAGDLRPGTPVVNITTVGPREADELSELVVGGGGRYLHAPVVGSVGAVRAGSVRLLVGAPSADATASASVLTDLGTPLYLGNPADAASAKLLANGVLGDAVRSVHAGLARATELGLSFDQGMMVLEETLLGRLVASKRPRLISADFASADFTVAALRKDVSLLAEAAPSALDLADWVSGVAGADAVAQDDDVSALCRPSSLNKLAHGLSCAPHVNLSDDVLAPLKSYVAAHATGDPAHHRAAFAPTARIEGHRDGAYLSWSLDEYCSMFEGRPAAGEATRTRRIDEVFVAGSVASARMSLHHGPFVFDDLFLLANLDGSWKIVNKVFRRTVEANGAD